MTRLTSSQLNTVRDKDQYTQIYLAKYEPPMVFLGQINDSAITKGEDVITYDNVVSGSYQNIFEGMTLYVGSTPGGTDIGRVRVRSATNSTITVAPDNGIHYQDNQYIMVKQFYEFWPVFPRAELNTGTLQATHYKDNDVAYSDQNTNFDPVVIMGPHFAGFFDTHSTISFSATGSYTVDGSTISSYLWAFPEGCSPTGSTSASPGNVTFPRSGHYTVKCTITTSTGKSLGSRRHITLLDRNAGTYLPYTDWEFGEVNSDFTNGSTCKLKLRNRAHEFKDGDLVILFTEDYYNDIKQSFGGYQGRSHILFVGYVDSFTNKYDYFDSESVLVLKGISAYMKNKEMFSISIDNNRDSATKWTEITDLTINKFLNHYLRWHTTMFFMNDFIDIQTDHGDYDENTIEIQKGEISSSFNAFLWSRVFGRLSSDRQGVCYAEVDLNMLTTGTRPSSVMTLLDTDWVGEPTFVEQIEAPLSNVTLGGEAYDPDAGTTGTSTALLSRAPGLLQSYVGKTQNLSGATLVSQDQCNGLSGLYYAKENNRYPEIELELAYTFRNIDVAPQEFYDFTIDTADTYRRINKTFRMIPRKIQYKFDNHLIKSSVTFETETHGPPGDTVVIPTEPPDSDCTDCIAPCPPEGCDPDPGPIIDATGPAHMYAAYNNYLFATDNFNIPSPTWRVIYDSTTLGEIQDFILDPFDPTNKGWIVRKLDTSGLPQVLYSSNLSATSPSWTEVFNASVASALGKTIVGGSGHYAQTIHASTVTAGKLYFVCVDDTPTFADMGCFMSTDYGSTWTFRGGISIGFDDISGPFRLDLIGDANLYVAVGDDSKTWSSSDGGANWTAGGAFGDNTVQPHPVSLHVVSATELYVVGGAGDTNHNENAYIMKSINGGVSWSSVTPTASTHLTVPDGGGNKDVSYAFSGAAATKIYALACRKHSASSGGVAEAPHLFRSTNGGSSWTLAYTFSVSPAYRYGGLGVWPYDANVIFVLTNDTGGPLMSLDAGDTWNGRNGNMASLIAGGTIQDAGLPVIMVPDWSRP